MLVSFYFECPIHGIYTRYLNTVDYPDRNWPKSLLCNQSLEGICVESERIPITDNFIQDSIGVSPAEDKHLIQMNKLYHSKSYLKRDLKSRGLSALTMEEARSLKSKTDDERHNEYLNRPDVKRRRREKINESLNTFGVIDGLKEV